MKSITLIIITIFALALAGCGESDLGTKVEAPANIEASTAKIQADPHMPQQAKDAQIAQLKAREAQGKAMADAAKNGHLSGQ